MSIIFGKLTNVIYTNNDDFTIYGLRVAGGERLSAICHSTDHPKALKTVELELRGEWVTDKKYGKQLIISEWKRSELLSNAHFDERKEVNKLNNRI